MHSEKSISLRLRLILITIFSIIIPMIVATFYSIFNFSEKTKEELLKSLESQNYSVNQMIEIEVKRVNSIAENIINDRGVNVTLEFQIYSQLSEYIKTLKERYKTIDNIVIYTTKGQKYLGEKEKNTSLRKLIDKRKNTNKDFFGLVKDKAFSIVSVNEIKNDNGKIVGILLLRSSMLKHNKYISEISKKLRLNLVLIRENKVFMMGEDSGVLNFFKKQEVLKIKNKSESFALKEEIKIAGENYHAFLKKLYDIDKKKIGYIATIEDSSKLRKSILEIIYGMSFIAILGISLAVAISVFLLSNMLIPLRTLVKTLKEVRKGDLTKRITLKKRDEIGLVGEYFNNTLDEIENMIIELDSANAKLKNADKIKDEFLANTSHELRTPLNGIIGLSESLIDGITGELPKSTVFNLEIIVSSGKRLVNLVNDILDFSKLNNKDLNIKKRATSIYGISGIVVLMNKRMADQKKIDLKNNIDPEFPLLLGDEDRLEQILYNLIGNALKFTEKGSISIEAELKDEFAEIRVKDTGIGIPKDKFDKIFEKFEQVDGSISRERGGTGLGLAISKKLIDLHGGRIYLESEINKGSTFIFTMPLASDRLIKEAKKLESNKKKYVKQRILTTPSTQVVIDQNDENSKKTILVVDDEPINIQIMLNHLSLRNYNVITASDGMEALEIIEKQGEKIDLLVLDIMMPKMSGYEVSRKLRNELNYSAVNLPILMLTAKNFPEDILLGFEAGANDYLPKPFDKNEMFARVKTLVQLKSTTKEAMEYTKEKQQRIISEELRIINKELSSVIKINLLLQMLLEKMRKWLVFKRALVFLFKEKKCDTYRYENNEENLIYDGEKNIQKNNALLNKIMEKKEPLIINDYSYNFFEYNIKGEHLLVLPIIYSNELKGIISFESTEELVKNSLELDFIYMVVSQAAIAIQNALLFEEINMWSLELEGSNKALEISIEELKLTQEQLILSEKMAVLGEMVAGVAHEINTPVGIGITAASLLGEKTREVNLLYESDELEQTSFEDYLKVALESSRLIEKNLSVAGELIKSFKKVSVNQMTEGKSSFNLDEHLRDIIISLKPAFRNTNVDIRVDCPSKLKIHSYPGSIMQIITNFIMNSLSHAFIKKEKGSISINIKEEEELIIISYKDDGKGIEQEFIAKVFDPFFTTKRNQGGTGLGLHIVYNVITQGLLGNVECNSKLGEGTEFLVKIPKYI